MKKLLTSRLCWGIPVAVVLFWLISIVLKRQHLFDLVNALAVSIGTGVLVAYLPAIYKAMTTPRRTGADYLVLGITCTWIGTVGRQIMFAIWRIFHYPPTVAEGVLFAFFVWVIIIGGMFHLFARGAINVDIPRVNWIIMGGVVAAGIAITMMIVFFVEPFI